MSEKRWIGGCRRRTPRNLQLCLSNSNIERSGGSAGDPLKRSGNSRHAEERSSNHNWQSRVPPKGALHLRSSSKPMSLPYAPQCYVSGSVNRSEDTMSSQPSPVSPVISVTATPEPYVDVKRAALYLAVAVKTLNEWARLQKIPAYQWGDGVRKTWRFKLSELDEWMGRRINSVRRPPLSERSVRREKEAH